jgi:hypothetical protein
MHHNLFSRSVYALTTAMLACVFVATSAQALTLREMRTLEVSDKQGKAFVQYYLIGVLEGVLEANAQSVRAGNKPLFCTEGRRLLPSMAKSIYDTEIKRNTELYEADMPAQLVMTNALVNAYTC